MNQSEKPSGFLSTLLKFFSKHNSPKTGSDIYCLTRYGRIMTREEILKRKIEEIDSMIFNLQNQGEYQVFRVIRSETRKYLDEIKEHYAKLDFIVKQLTIEETGDGVEYLFISWYKKNL